MRHRKIDVKIMRTKRRLDANMMSSVAYILALMLFLMGDECDHEDSFLNTEVDFQFITAKEIRIAFHITKSSHSILITRQSAQIARFCSHYNSLALGTSKFPYYKQ